MIKYNEIKWDICVLKLVKMQEQIAQAVTGKDWEEVRVLQGKLVGSFSARALAVKKVCGNIGSRTPGIDGILWESDEQRMEAIMTLGKVNYEPSPVKRVMIPKANGKQRPLGIPTMLDRAKQALY
jgi:RNA-directed DNA polymerase